MSEQAPFERPRTPIVVWAIAAAILLAQLGFTLADPATRDAIDYAFALIPERFSGASQHRFAHWYEAAGPVFGHAFLHVGWLHAGLNAFFFTIMARAPALKLGALRFLALFFISAAAGAFAFVALNWGGREVAVGASGAVCGVFSAYFLSARPTWLQALAEPRVRNPYALIFVLNVVVMGVVAEADILPIAWEGHLGGFVGGALAWIALAPRPRGPWG